MLGFEDLVAVQTSLANARTSRQELVDEADGEQTTSGRCSTQSTRRTRTTLVDSARKALKSKTWDLATLEKITQLGETREASQIDALRRLESIEPPDEAVVELGERLAVRGSCAREFAARTDQLSGGTRVRAEF